MRNLVLNFKEIEVNNNMLIRTTILDDNFIKCLQFFDFILLQQNKKIKFAENRLFM